MSNLLPEFYNRIIPEISSMVIPEEKLASCSQCVMSVNCRTNRSEITYNFDPNLKCCTYYPLLPNYLVGAILDDESLKNVHSLIKDLIKNGNVDEYGLKPTKEYILKYQNSNKGFGLNEDLICPFYNRSNTNCSIWKYRNAACTSYYCKHLGGHIGQNFWDEFRIYIGGIEHALSSHFVNTHPFKANLEEYYIQAYHFVSTLQNHNLKGNLKESICNTKKLRSRLSEYTDLPEKLIINEKYINERTALIKQLGIEVELSDDFKNIFNGKRIHSSSKLRSKAEDVIHLEEEFVILLFHNGILIE